MQKFWLSLTVLAALALSACAQVTPAPIKPAGATPTLAGGNSLPVGQATSTPVSCVPNPRPTPNPTDIASVPAVSDKDWVTGPASAGVSIIEYSDFQ
jgi:hypothetical protein